MEPATSTDTCSVCGRAFDQHELVPAELVRPSLAHIIRRELPSWSGSDRICLDDLHRMRSTLVEEMLESERGELSDLDAEVIAAMREQEILSQNVNAEFEHQLTLGERIADRVATFGGSWTFILTFGGILVVWIALNSVQLLRRPFDPYPYILLNLVLSTLAALQAPVIMMSQNRQESKDRLRGENEYRINLKAELEIRLLSARLDQLMTRQWQRLLEIQQIQMELMEEIASHRRTVEDEEGEGAGRE